jgi:thymidine kinase
MSKLYFSYAAMNAGKSTVLLQASYNYQERGMRTLMFTSALYAKAEDGRITSRIGINSAAELYSEADDLHAWIAREHRKARVSCVFVDEAQFLTRQQVWQLARIADRPDFQGRLFEGSSELLAIADSLREIRTICHCGRKATMVVRRTPDGRALVTGDQIGIEKSMYLSLCRLHWEEETGSWPIARPKLKQAIKPVPRKKIASKKKKSAAKAPLRIAAARAKAPPRKRR